VCIWFWFMLLCSLGCGVVEWCLLGFVCLYHLVVGVVWWMNGVVYKQSHVVGYYLQ
jgi:hypothetical protein